MSTSSMLADATMRSDKKSVIYHTKAAYTKGYLNDKHQTVSFLSDITANLSRKTHGKRYTTALEDLYKWLRIKGGAQDNQFSERER